MVVELLFKISPQLTTMRTSPRKSTQSEILINGDNSKSIKTLDSVFIIRESGKVKEDTAEETKDIVYSSVVQPEKLRNTINLYKRLNIIPKNEAVMVEGEEFYDCRSDEIYKSIPKSENLKEYVAQSHRTKLNRDRSIDKVPKKNAFYTSKYLIIDPKDKDFTKQTDTQELDTPMADKKRRSSSILSVQGNSFIEDWLRDISMNEKRRSADSTKSRTEKQKKIRPPLESKKSDSEKIQIVDGDQHYLENKVQLFKKRGSLDTIKRSNLTASTSTTGTSKEQKISERSSEKLFSLIQPKNRNRIKHDSESSESTIQETSKTMKNKIEQTIPINEVAAESHIKPETNKKMDQQTENSKNEVSDYPTSEINTNLRMISPKEIQLPKMVPESDSEFDIEKSKRGSSSSGLSFNLDEYYSKVMQKKNDSQI